MMRHITRIKAKISIYARKKTSNIFDGSYKSIYTGNGFEFDNLREYIPGDNIRDIDWKASSRSGNLLVKRYIAEKKHNVMLVFDTGKGMCADTKALQTKKEVVLNIGGTLGYIASRNGDQVGALYNRNGFIQYYPLKSGLDHLERILTGYEKEHFEDYQGDLEKSLDYLIKHIRRKMIICVISDAMGIKNIGDDTLKKLACQHDVLFVSISDADITSGQSYQIDKGMYIPEFISNNKRLQKLEQETKQRIYDENAKKLLKHRIVLTQIDNEEEIPNKVIELLERYKYANNC